ncbi:hypothetical protein Ac2012v2_002018 [Leucoagaricus gongylophorus]
MFPCLYLVKSLPLPFVSFCFSYWKTDSEIWIFSFMLGPSNTSTLEFFVLRHYCVLTGTFSLLDIIFSGADCYTNGISGVGFIMRKALFLGSKAPHDDTRVYVHKTQSY